MSKLERRYAAHHQKRNRLGFTFVGRCRIQLMDQMYSISLLLAAMEKARGREPRLTLWLVGAPSRRVEVYSASRP